MARRLLCSPTVTVLFFLNLVLFTLLVSNEVARTAIAHQLSANHFLSDWTLAGDPAPDAQLEVAPSPAAVTRTVYEHRTEYATQTAVATATRTEVRTQTVVSVQTVAPPRPEGMPAFCDECGPEDKMCATYGLRNLERSRAYEGPNTRLRRVLQKAADGHPINIGVLGGSVTAGHGVAHPEYWTDIFFEWWQKTFPHEKNVFVNGAVPATTTEYYSVCALEHINEEVDLVIIEMAINDPRNDWFAKSYEWLVRLLSDLPNKPAIVNAQIIALSFDSITTGGDLHTGVAEYYDIPTVSLRNVALYHVLEHSELDRDMFHRLPPFQPDSEPDLRHINRVGHKLMADFLIAYMERQICAQARLKNKPELLQFTPQQHYIPGPSEFGEIPRLRMFQKYVHDVRLPPTKTTCMSTRSKKHPLLPVRQTGWENWSWKDKTFLLAREPGARATFAISGGPMGFIKVSYLKSKTFGLGSVKCWLDADEENARRIDGWWDEDGLNISRDSEVAVGVAPGPHEVTCEVLQETLDPGGGHEFRLISLTSS